jgi:uncharacterized membrane protein (DUF485 family)
MQNNIIEAIKNNPNYQKLVRERTSFSLKLAGIMLVMYYAFVLTIAFDKKLLAIKIASVTTIGIPIGIAIIVISFVLTGIYTKRANGEFDELTDKIKDDVKRMGA